MKKIEKSTQFSQKKKKKKKGRKRKRYVNRDDTMQTSSYRTWVGSSVKRLWLLMYIWQNRAALWVFSVLWLFFSFCCTMTLKCLFNVKIWTQKIRSNETIVLKNPFLEKTYIYLLIPQEGLNPVSRHKVQREKHLNLFK